MAVKHDVCMHACQSLQAWGWLGGPQPALQRSRDESGAERADLLARADHHRGTLLTQPLSYTCTCNLLRARAAGSQQVNKLCRSDKVCLPSPMPAVEAVMIATLPAKRLPLFSMPLSFKEPRVPRVYIRYLSASQSDQGAWQ